jgi:hypothetical protein
MLGGQYLAFLLTHRGKVFETFHDLNAAKTAERDTVTRLTEAETGLQHRIQEIGFVNDPHLTATWLEMNGRHLNFEFWKTHLLSVRQAPAHCSEESLKR